TFDIAPRAGAAAFDDSAWRVLEPDRLDDEKLGAGKLCFAWYRIRVTVPERVGALATAGSTITFETVVDDYAEVWADGQLPIRLGAIGGQFAAGFNAPNRVVLTTDARPGQTIQIAVFGVNAPLSAPPDNFVFMRSAKLEFAPAVAK
ncbi:MAG TPA: hypothetical protein VD963_10225, partial [Phycisphaerales bacterium]|nr:hypothetical protein [Phycisphaerales bacterium]